MQKVSLGVTLGGQHGLFTNRVLAFPLSFNEYYRLITMDRELAAKFVRVHWEFELIGENGAWWTNNEEESKQ
jgi:hypothetical protein